MTGRASRKVLGDPKAVPWRWKVPGPPVNKGTPEAQAKSKERARLDHRHRVKRHKQRNHKQNKIFVTSYKADRGCQICGEKDPCCLDLHHVNPAEKVSEVSAMLSLDHATVVLECRKCMVVCANCHRKIHHRQRTTPEFRIEIDFSGKYIQLPLFVDPHGSIGADS